MADLVADFLNSTYGFPGYEEEESTTPKWRSGFSSDIDSVFESLYGPPTQTEPEWEYRFKDRLSEQLLNEFGSLWKGISLVSDKLGFEGARDWASNRGDTLFEKAADLNVQHTSLQDVWEDKSPTKFLQWGAETLTSLGVSVAEIFAGGGAGAVAAGGKLGTSIISKGMAKKTLQKNLDTIAKEMGEGASEAAIRQAAYKKTAKDFGRVVGAMSVEGVHGASQAAMTEIEEVGYEDAKLWRPAVVGVLTAAITRFSPIEMAAARGTISKLKDKSWSSIVGTMFKEGSEELGQELLQVGHKAGIDPDTTFQDAINNPDVRWALGESFAAGLLGGSMFGAMRQNWRTEGRVPTQEEATEYLDRMTRAQRGELGKRADLKTPGVIEIGPTPQITATAGMLRQDLARIFTGTTEAAEVPATPISLQETLTEGYEPTVPPTRRTRAEESAAVYEAQRGKEEGPAARIMSEEDNIRAMDEFTKVITDREEAEAWATRYVQDKNQRRTIASVLNEESLNAVTTAKNRAAVREEIARLMAQVEEDSNNVRSEFTTPKEKEVAKRNINQSIKQINSILTGRVDVDMDLVRSSAAYGQPISPIADTGMEGTTGDRAGGQAVQTVPSPEDIVANREALEKAGLTEEDLVQEPVSIEAEGFIRDNNINDPIQSALIRGDMESLNEELSSYAVNSRRAAVAKAAQELAPLLPKDSDLYESVRSNTATALEVNKRATNKFSGQKVTDPIAWDKIKEGAQDGVHKEKPSVRVVIQSEAEGAKVQVGPWKVTILDGDQKVSEKGNFKSLVEARAFANQSVAPLVGYKRTRKGKTVAAPVLKEGQVERKSVKKEGPSEVRRPRLTKAQEAEIIARAQAKMKIKDSEITAHEEGKRVRETEEIEPEEDLSAPTTGEERARVVRKRTPEEKRRVEERRAKEAKEERTKKEKLRKKIWDNIKAQFDFADFPLPDENSTYWTNPSMAPKIAKIKQLDLAIQSNLDNVVRAEEVYGGKSDIDSINKLNDAYTRLRIVTRNRSNHADVLYNVGGVLNAHGITNARTALEFSLKEFDKRREHIFSSLTKLILKHVSSNTLDNILIQSTGNVLEDETSYWRERERSVFIHEIHLKKDKLARVLVHEILHGLTAKTLKNNEEFFNQIESIRQEVVKHVLTKGSAWFKESDLNVLRSMEKFGIKEYKERIAEFQAANSAGLITSDSLYGLTSPIEFVAEVFGDTAFRNMLAAIPNSKAVKGFSLRTLFDKVTHFIADVLGFIKSENHAGNMLGRALAETAKIIEAQEINSYIKSISSEEDAFDLQAKKSRATYTAEELRVKHEEGLADYVGMTTDKWESAKKYGSRLARMGQTYFRSITSILNDASPILATKIRGMEMEIRRKTMKRHNDIQEFVKKIKKIDDKMEQAELYYHLINSGKENIDERKRLLAKHGLTEAYKGVEFTLEKIRREAESVGLDEFPMIEGYFPRHVIDLDGLIKDMKKAGDDYGKIQQAVDAMYKDQGMEVTEEQMTQTVLSILRTGKFPNVIRVPGAAKERTINRVLSKYMKYYAKPEDALVNHVFEMTEAIEGRRFLGITKQPQYQRRIQTLVKELKKKDITEERKEDIALELDHLHKLLTDTKYQINQSVSSYVAKLVKEGKLKGEDEGAVTAAIRARLTQRGMHGPLSHMRDVGLVTALGSFVSTLTQLNDVVHSIYEYGLGTTAKAIMGKKTLSIHDLDLGHAMTEISTSPTSRWVDRVLTWTGFKGLDMFLKATTMESAIQDGRRLSRDDFFNKFERVFAEDTEAIYKALHAPRLDKNNKHLRFFAFYELSKIQPVSMSEMPIGYNTAGNGRIFYTLKSYNLKIANRLYDQLKGVWDKDSTPAQKREAVYQFATYLALLTLSGASADELKDWIQGKEKPFSDQIGENMLKIFFLSRYTLDKGFREGMSATILKDILAPPTGYIDTPIADISNWVQGESSYKTLQLVPIAGKIIWQWTSDGREKELGLRKKYINEQIRGTVTGDTEWSTIRKLIKDYNQEAIKWNRGKKKDEKIALITATSISRVRKDEIKKQKSK